MGGGLIPLAQNIITAGLGLIGQLTINQKVSFSITDNTTNGVVLLFSGFQVPHSLGPIGGVQRHVVHEFPGGTKTIQTIGPFPEALRWRGILMGADGQGRTPLEQAVFMDQLRRTGNPITVRYSQLKWFGIVSKWTADIKQQNWLEYECEVEPVSDNMAEINFSPPTSQSGILAGLISKIKTFLTGTIGLDPAIILEVTKFASLIDGALLSAGGIISAIDPSDIATIMGAAGILSVVLGPFVNSTSLPVSNSANSLIALIKASSGLINAAPGVNSVKQTVNPNLITQATKYLGDASRWPEIAKANGTIDSSIAGLVALNIPNPPTQ